MCGLPGQNQPLHEQIGIPHDGAGSWQDGSQDELSKTHNNHNNKLSSVQVEDSLLLLDESKHPLDFVVAFKSMWADNGDQLSQLYSGSSFFVIIYGKMQPPVG